MNAVEKSYRKRERYLKICCCLIIFFSTNNYLVFCQIREDVRQKKISDQESNDEVKMMIDILNNKNNKKSSPEAIFEAIKTLERLKDPQATQALIDYLDYEKISGPEFPNYTNGIHLVTLSGRYPAIGALIKIGGSALSSLIIVIETEESDSIRSQNALYTVQQLFLNNLQEGIGYLEKSRDNSITQNGKLRLQKAIKNTKELVLKISKIKNKKIN